MTTDASEKSLKIVRTFAAPLNKVYRAWTDPNQMGQWMGPGTMTCKEIAVDLKEGGAYRIHMFSEEDGDHIAFGKYKNIIPDQKLVFTWSWESGTVTDSLVTVEFAARGNSTQVTLLHEDLPAKEAAEKHTVGWNACLDKLDGFVK